MVSKEALLYRPLGEGRVECTACARRCAVKPGQHGLCGIRSNHDGRLHLDVYGKIVACHVDPIEKKPVTHYRPGSRILSIATTGCNWLCRYCQNHDISQRRVIAGEDVTPEEVVDRAVETGCQGIAYTYNQPTIFLEFARDVGIEARRRGLFNVFVSNGYDTPEAVALMGDFLDCITVDFKGNAERGFSRKFIGIADPAPIFDTLQRIRDETDVHVEITDLVVPGVGDDLEAARALSAWIRDHLGPRTPIHFLRFHPDYKMMDTGWTPVSTLEEHWRVAREEGLQHVYVGNVPGHPKEHTVCAACGAVVIRRRGFSILAWNLRTAPDGSNACAECGSDVPVVGGLEGSHREPRFFSADR